MPKTQTFTCKQVSDWQHVSYALRCAAKGKLQQSNVQNALQNPEKTIASVSQALRKGRLPAGCFHNFKIYDPKERVIHAAPFLDRIAHHAIILLLEPVFERVLLPSVFACRPNKGVHKAILYAQKQSRRFSWVMHIDIEHYFPAIDHSLLKQQLRKRFKGDGLALLNNVIDSFKGETKGKGLPIGSLTSQHFANHYLNDIDRWSLTQKGVKAHCRYMDDFLFWSNNKQSLVDFEHKLRSKLAGDLLLKIKDPVLKRTKQSLLFCGIFIRPFSLKASKRRKQHFFFAWKRWEAKWIHDEINGCELQNGYASALAILLPAQEDCFLRRQLKKQGAIDA